MKIKAMLYKMTYEAKTDAERDRILDQAIADAEADGIMGVAIDEQTADDIISTIYDRDQIMDNQLSFQDVEAFQKDVRCM